MITSPAGRSARPDTLLIDIGGVFLTNGWDRHARAAAIARFDLDAVEVGRRHEEVAPAFECGEISLDSYLNTVIFYQQRDFDRDAFIDFMHSRSRAYDTLELLAELADSGLYRIATINNESRELNRYRIETFGLDRWFDAFFSSCYLGVRKPDPRIYRIALDILRPDPARCLFIDDRRPNTDAAEAVGLRAVHAPDPAGLRSLLRAAGVMCTGGSTA